MSVLPLTASREASTRNVREPFLTASELLERLEKPATEHPLRIDARGVRQYRDGHLPQAINVPARELNPVENGVRRLATLDEVGRNVGSAGEREVVIYGGRGGADAAHLWWTLRAVGFECVRLLDGGLEAWLAEGGSLAGEGEAFARAETLTAALKTDVRSNLAEENREQVWPQDSLVAIDELLRRLGDRSVAIVDTRESEEFSGELRAAERGGHIPGAILFPWTSALDTELRLRPESELRELLAPVLEKPEAIIYCQSGVRAAHTLAVLEMLRHPRPRLYLGSWGEWGNRQDTPLEVEAGS